MSSTKAMPLVFFRFGWLLPVLTLASTPFLPHASVSTALLCSLGLLLAWTLLLFVSADADLALLLRGPHAQDAFQGKVVLVTGASRGLGEAVAIYLASRGARLILSSRSRPALEAVKAKCVGPHAAETAIRPLDVTADWATMEKFAADADAAFGGLDYVFHVAGASQSAAAEEATAEVARQMVDLNMLGPIVLTRALVTHMLTRGRGRFVVVASMASKVPSPGQALYSATKQGLFGYFASLATEVSDRGVGVTIACPGPIASERAGEPRTVFGPTGMITRHEDAAGNSKKVKMARCVELICAAAAHGVDEAWIVKHPVLLAGYIMQYLPPLGWWMLKKIGPKRTRALKAGKSGYSYNLATSKSD